MEPKVQSGDGRLEGDEPIVEDNPFNADQRIETFVTVVCVGIPDQRLISDFPDNVVVLVSGEEPSVRTGTTVAGIVSEASEHPVVATLAQKNIGPGFAMHDVVAGSTLEQVGTAASEHPVIAAIPDEPIRPRTSEQEVVARSSKQLIVPRSAEQPVVSGPADEAVVAD